MDRINSASSKSANPMSDFIRFFRNALDIFRKIDYNIFGSDIKEGAAMPTSSIFANFSIKDKETAERFVDALERSANDPERTPTSTNLVHVSDKDNILKLFAQRKKDR